MTDQPMLHLAVALDGAGWHPAAWREPTARPRDLVTAGYWVELAQLADDGLVDFLTIEDSLALQSSRTREHDQRTDLVRGRLDAVMIAARVAPLTRHIGLVPSVTVTHTEPFHISKAIATLDFVSHGRAGVRVQISARPYEARHFGRRTFPAQDPAPAPRPGTDPGARDALVTDLFDEAADYVDVVRRLWDSWEDGAEIRDIASGRFVDRDKLHYIDFRGRWFNVKGPSITPRPPQGQPLVTALAHSTLPYRFAAPTADVVFVTPQDPADAIRIIDEVRALQDEFGRRPADVTVMADLVAFLAPSPAEATDRKGHLDELFGKAYRSDAHLFVGTPAGLADLMEEWQSVGVQGFRVRPAGIPHDVEALVHEVVPELQRRSLFRTDPAAGSLRTRFGLARPENRYVRR